MGKAVKSGVPSLADDDPSDRARIQSAHCAVCHLQRLSAGLTMSMPSFESPNSSALTYIIGSQKTPASVSIILLFLLLPPLSLPIQLK